MGNGTRAIIHPKGSQKRCFLSRKAFPSELIGIWRKPLKLVAITKSQQGIELFLDHTAIDPCGDANGYQRIAESEIDTVMVCYLER